MRNWKAKLIKLLMNLQSSFWISYEMRKKILKLGGSKFGERCIIKDGLTSVQAKLFLKDNVFINRNLMVDGAGEVHIGKNVKIGPNCTFVTGAHKLMPDATQRASFEVYPQTIRIGAGAVVNKDLSSNGLYVGIPAKKIRDLPV